MPSTRENVASISRHVTLTYRFSSFQVLIYQKTPQATARSGVLLSTILISYYLVVPWSPYDKTGSGLLLTKEYPYIGVPASHTSGLEKFEAPDPADWCPRGYAVVLADARGTFNSEGDMYQFGTQVRCNSQISKKTNIC